jgi:hypothetical protein
MSTVDVEIGSGGAPGRFRVEIRSSAAGDASAEVGLDVGALLAGRDQFQQVLLASGVAARQVLTEAERGVRETGQMLFTALLGSGEVAGCYRANAALSEERGEELRIVLRLDAPELAGLPWEAMYDPGTGGYVCRQHQLVRHVPVAAVPPPLSVRTPLRVLGVVPALRGLSLAALDSAREREQLTRALAPLSAQGLAELAWAPQATWDGLHEMLLSGPWHVLHFIGHGGFDVGRDEGILALAREDGQADYVEASRFASLLRQARPMPRLVVLNSCSGGATGTQDLFSGTAAALARSGVAAVTAMQYSISDRAAVAFARGFYAALTRGRGVDEAVSAGRIAILGTSGQTLEWITPVMYMRGRDARLFTMPGDQAAEAPVPPASQPAGKPASTGRRSTRTPDGRLYHTVRNSDGTWLSPFRLVERMVAGGPSQFTGVACAGTGTAMHLVGVGTSGRLWHAVRGADGNWEGTFKLVERLVDGAPRAGFSAVACGGTGDDVQVIAFGADSRIYHTLRYSDGTWQAFFGHVEAKVSRGPRAFAGGGCAGVGAELHVVGVGDDGGLHHTIRYPDGTWRDPFETVKQPAGGSPTGFALASCTGVGTELHLIGTTRGGQLWHTIRQADGRWQSKWTRVADVVADGPTEFTAVTCAAAGPSVHLLGTGDDGRLYHTVRYSDGFWQRGFGIIETRVSGGPQQFTFASCAGLGNALQLVGGGT